MSLQDLRNGDQGSRAFSLVLLWVLDRPYFPDKITRDPRSKGHGALCQRCSARTEVFSKGHV